MSKKKIKSLGVLTSGGDAQGMNAALRAVVRSALYRGLEVYAIYEGYQGMVDGGAHIKQMYWDSVGSILIRGGTIIGSARCMEFRTREGRLKAAHNLLKHDIDNLVIIGGDGSLTGASLFRQEWSDLLAELVANKQVSQRIANQHPHLTIVGLAGSIDNDMFGTDMTIGTDTALHRVTTAIDRISSTAASHQRSFVVEVMGRHCGYLALMSALATGADWVMIPERPVEGDNWEETMCEVLKAGRMMGRRDSIVIVAEGAQDQKGQPITGDYVTQVLRDRLGEDARLTVLGHVQRGGSPSAFDRYLATISGYAAVEEILAAEPDDPPVLIGLKNNQITRSPLTECVEQTRDIAKKIEAHDYETAMKMRGGSFTEAYRTFRTLTRALPHPPEPGQKQLRLAVINVGSLAPGMNAAVRVATRLGLDQGHTILGVKNGFSGLINGDIEEMEWMQVEEWASRGGSELGTNRRMPENADFYAIARHIEAHNIQGLLVIGGWTGYLTIHQMLAKRDSFPAFNIPIICLPATINNNLPGSELSIGADTALNNIISAVDKIKESAVATRRCFVVEVMGRYCGYLALMSGFITGAERVYIHEEGVKLDDLQADLIRLKRDFEEGKRLGLVIRNEYVNPFYNAEFMVSLFEEEGEDAFDVRKSILGHLQRGGDPSPFDRIQATRLATECINYLIKEASAGMADYAFIGLQGGKVRVTDMKKLPDLANIELQRPHKQWWMALRPIASIFEGSGPQG